MTKKKDESMMAGQGRIIQQLARENDRETNEADSEDKQKIENARKE